MLKYFMVYSVQFLQPMTKLSYSLPLNIPNLDVGECSEKHSLFWRHIDIFNYLKLIYLSEPIYEKEKRRP